MRETSCILVFVLISFLLTGVSASGETRPEKTERESVLDAASETEESGRLYDLPVSENRVTGKKYLYFPPGDLYPPYAADPFRVGFAIQPVHVIKSSIPDSSDSRVNLKTGGQVAIFRSQPLGQPDLGWQVSLMGGFSDQNDVRYSLDNIGWDGHYGLLVSTAPVKGLAYKFGFLHVSSHVGDEYIERTGRLRISYTRQELVAGISWFLSDRWRIYAETGDGYSRSNNELQKPWRIQFGAEYESPPKFWKERLAWYAGLDCQSMQERDWRLDVAVQTGYVVRSVGRSWRFGVEWYNGRPPIGEFFQYTERYISMGVWIDI